MIDIVLQIIAVLAIFIIATHFISKRKNVQTYWHIVSMIKSKRFIPLLDRFVVFKKALSFFATLGLISGFGIIAIDFLYAKKAKTKLKRIAILIFSFLVLYLLFYFGVSAMFENPLTNSPRELMSAFFAIGGFALFTFYFLADHAFYVISRILIGEKSCAGVAPVIPGVQLPNVPISVPLYAWIPLFFILIIHEGFHGILARRHKIPIKSAGVLLFGILPIGAFVEPDDKYMKKVSERKKLEVFSAGPTSNLVSAVIFLLAMSLVMLPLFSSLNDNLAGIKKQSITELQIADVNQTISFCNQEFKSSAYGVMQKGMVLEKVNDVDVNIYEDVAEQLSKTWKKPTSFELLDKNSGKITKVTLQSNELGKFGFDINEVVDPNYKFPENYELILLLRAIFFGILIWFFMLSLAAGMLNFMPIEPFDGGKIAKIMFVPYLSFMKKTVKEKELWIQGFLWKIFLVLLFLNILPMFL